MIKSTSLARLLLGNGRLDKIFREGKPGSYLTFPYYTVYTFWEKYFWCRFASRYTRKSRDFEECDAPFSGKGKKSIFHILWELRNVPYFHPDFFLSNSVIWGKDRSGVCSVHCPSHMRRVLFIPGVRAANPD